MGLKLELMVGLLLWLEFGVGLKLELGVGLKLEGSFPFLNWWCLVGQIGLRLRRGTSST